MKSVADELARKGAEETLQLSPGERVQLALRLGDEAVAIHAAANGVSEAEARRILRHGRPSAEQASTWTFDEATPTTRSSA